MGDLARMRQAPTHPGEIFKLEFRVPLKTVSQAEAARRLTWSTNRMNEFETGKRGVTAENALMLARLTGTTAQFWVNLQARYDLWHALQACAGTLPAITPMTGADRAGRHRAEPPPAD